ncbi:DUF1802 family protein [Urbifossiella limnaea]|uniref:DUF1802 family protein n=1 Tax=Urbifossiella limnaea TaxID=2528023 RepID=A0A517XUP4_9BACT|nr:DUF1802 family protein [Urbifossiella limnaea]QDU21230.1 hypothetical protein ETAA1_31950 [Urbifossiella limnaea]
MATVAFKEWAVICRALAEGRQAVILRKGGIAETAGEFRPEHERFLLLPTHFHEQHRTGIKSELLPLLDAAEADRPGGGVLRFTHLAEVTAVRKVSELDHALALDGLHGWTADTVRQRFHYRSPGLFVLTVRVAALPAPVEVPERPEYAGCKTWVELVDDVPTDGATPVLSDTAFAAYSAKVNATLIADSNSSS